MSLPLAWADRIFDKLTLTYGQSFLNRWRDLDLNAVKSDWMHELSGFENAPHAIAYALSNLPDSPPTVLQFRAIARSAPAVGLPALPEPKANPERLAEELAKLAPLREMLKTSAAPMDCKQWAKTILASPKGRTPTVLQMARNALESA
jgi:hypothetical protein